MDRWWWIGKWIDMGEHWWKVKILGRTGRVTVVGRNNNLSSLGIKDTCRYLGEMTTGGGDGVGPGVSIHENISLIPKNGKHQPSQPYPFESSHLEFSLKKLSH